MTQDPASIDRERVAARGARMARAQRSIVKRSPYFTPKTEAERARDAERFRLGTCARCGNLNKVGDIPRLCGGCRRAVAKPPPLKVEPRACGAPAKGKDEFGEPRTCKAIVPCRWHPERRK